MQGSTQLKAESEPAVAANAAGSRAAGFRLIPRPRTLGVFVIIVTFLAFIAGWVRNELALTLLGTIFLVILVYSFLGVFFLGLLHRRKARFLSMTISSETVITGKEAELCVKSSGPSPEKIRFLRFPAILVRCELHLETRDGRVIRHFADPAVDTYSRFPVKERGAYSPEIRSDPRSRGQNRFVIFDAPGFFRLSFSILSNGSSRLLALPAPAEEVIPVSLKAGGSEQRNESHYRKSDELTNHRPYIPGDDPRRINWKLYGHAPMGELFVREGEPEPPPHSRLLILIDTEADISLYTIDEGRRAVDLLCENALAAALELSGQGMDILIAYTGGGIMGDRDSSGPLNAEELASALAWPAAIPWPLDPGEKKRPPGELQRQIPGLPPAPQDRGVLVFALPRSSSEPSALDRFLKNREQANQKSKQETDIIFLYDAESGRAAELEDSSRVCVNLYNRKPGVRAGRAAAARGATR